MELQALLLDWSKQQASFYLSPLIIRWQHVLGVVDVASEICGLFNAEERGLLLAAAYLHDVAYSSELRVTGFHPLDGALFVRSHGYERLACLIAHHSGARFEAALRGLETQMAEFPRERSSLADALDYCDLSVGPTGERAILRQRAADIFMRYGPDDVVSKSFKMALPYLALEVGRTNRRLKAKGLSQLI